jgi:hypothetical protein
MSALTVNLDLVQKYNVAGPRYTSYPPATKFTDTSHLFIRNLAICFDNTLTPSGERKHSRTVYFNR